MDDPETEIRGVITQLCTGSKDEQAQALETYFTNDASFTHPFCSVTDDRTQIIRIFQWYKILSPHIDITVHSTGTLLSIYLLHIGDYDAGANKDISIYSIRSKEKHSIRQHQPDLQDLVRPLL